MDIITKNDNLPVFFFRLPDVFKVFFHSDLSPSQCNTLIHRGLELYKKIKIDN